MNNFLSETLWTFLLKQNVSSCESGWFYENDLNQVPLEVRAPGIGRPDTVYSMYVVLKNSRDINEISDFQDAAERLTKNLTYCSLNVHTSSITMYSRATSGYNIDPHLYGSSFGPPVFSQLGCIDTTVAPWNTGHWVSHSLSLFWKFHPP